MPVEPDEAQRRTAAFRRTCAQSGIRITPQRTEIFRELARTEEHPDAETVLRRVRRRMSNVSLDTVYRTLYLLEELGLVSRVGILAGRARFDANTERHHHFVCVQCGRVRDFVGPPWEPCPIPQEVEGMGTVRSVHVQLRGVCEACAARERKGGKLS